MKKIKYSLIVFIGILSALFLCYKYSNIPEYKSNNPISTSTVSSTITTIEYPAVSKNSGIIPNEVGMYKNLNEEGKKILDDWYKSIREDVSGRKEFQDSSFLKYYDEKIAIIGGFTIKPTVPIRIYNRKDMSLVDDANSTKDINYAFGYAENKRYMITAYDDGVVYYKAGDYNFKLLPNSALREGETYSKTNEMVNEYELSISTTSPSILKASIFSTSVYDGKYLKKLREVKYTLPQ